MNSPMNDFSLHHYTQIIHKKKSPAFLKTKFIPVSYKKTNSLESLWKVHNDVSENGKEINTIPNQSLLDLKIDIAEKLFSDCILCEHRCHIDRNKKSGICGVTIPRITSEFLHRGEEKIFTPSHTIFFSGCNFQCVFCQNHRISQQSTGVYLSPQQIYQKISSKFDQGSLNVNWVGGEPTPNLVHILKTINQIDESIPQIWNSNMYCSMETMNLLNGVIDVFLTDFKFGNDKCAHNLASVHRYFDVVTRNHSVASKYADVFIRHLVLPNHTKCCSHQILSWISHHLLHIPVHIMDQYYPAYKANDIQQLQRTCLSEELNQVHTFGKKLKISIY